jgi:hypothetical protein
MPTETRTKRTTATHLSPDGAGRWINAPEKLETSERMSDP